MYAENKSIISQKINSEKIELHWQKSIDISVNEYDCRESRHEIYLSVGPHHSTGQERSVQSPMFEVG